MNQTFLREDKIKVSLSNNLTLIGPVISEEKMFENVDNDG